MNKIYRLVWNKSLSLWTVVSENARGVTKKRNVTTNTSIKTAVSCGEISKQSQLKPTLIALTISSAFFSGSVFAEVNTGGGAVSNSNGSSMAISPTAQQCGSGGQASVNGNSGLAVGCGNNISGVDATRGQALFNRRGSGNNNYPTGQAQVLGSATTVGKDNIVRNSLAGATLVGTSNISEGNGFHNIGVGQGNLVGGAGYNTAIGVGNDVSTSNSNVVIGVNNRSRGSTSIAMGRLSWADADFSIAQGNAATVAQGATGAISLGHSATTTGIRGIAIGSSTGSDAGGPAQYDPATAANADGADSVAVGTGAKAAGNQTTAVGRQAKATGNNSAAYGNQANAQGASSVSVGDNSQAQGDNDIALGRNAATASGGSNNIAVGNGVTTGSTGQNVAMGSGTTTANAGTADGGAVAIGRDQKAAGDGAVAIGDPNNANGNGAVAVGRNNTAAGNDAASTAADGAVALGNENKAIGQGSVALGNRSTAAAAGAIALGDAANAQASRGIALGSNAVATNAEDVALGAGSQTSTATGAAYRTGTAAPASVVSVGTAGNERRIQNLSDGAADTDAVNVRQLKNVQDGVDQLGESTADALGGGSSYDPATGAVTAPNYNVNGNTVNNVGDAITALDKGWTLQSNGENAGAVKAGDTVDIGTADGEENLQVTKEGNDIKYSLNRDLKVDSVTAGDTVINNDGMSIVGGPSVTKSGIDAAGNKVKNVADGTEASDAVNKGQLDKAGQDLTDKGFGLTAQDGTTVQKKLGEAVDVVGADENISTKVQDGKVAIELAKDLNVNSVKAGDTTINNDGLSIAGGPSVTKSGIDAAGNTISNVGPGVAGTDAVNKDQLDNAAAAAKTEVTEGKNITVTKTTSDDGQDIYNVATADDVEFNNVKVGEVTIDGTTGKISGVAAGDVNPDSTDAINGSQLAKNAKSVSDALGGGSTVNPDGTVTAPNYTVNGADVNNVGDAITALDKGWTLQSNGENAGAVKAGDTVDIGTADGEENLKVAKEGNDIKYSLNRDLKVDSVTAGDTVINNDGMTITGGPSVTKSGIDAAGNTISNVGPGVAGTDAVNKDQLDNAAAATKTEVMEGKNITVTKTTGDDGQDIYNVATADDVEFNNVKVGDVTIDGTTGKISGVAAGDVNPDSTDAINGSQLAKNAKSVSDALGGGSTVNPGGTVTAPNYTVNGADVNNVGDAITALDKGWTLQSNGENAGAVKAGDTVDIGTADGEENLKVAKEGNDIKYSLNRDLKVDSVTAGDTVINNDGMTITGGPSVTKSGIDAAGNTISNVGPGVAGTDAVNKDQLDKAGQDLTDKGFGLTAQDGTTIQKKLGEAVDVVGADENISTKVQDGKVAIELAKDLNVNSVKAGDTTINNDGLTIVNGPSITKSGIDAGNQKISNVADGEVTAGSKDAVNGGQLNDSVDSAGNILGGGVTNEGGKLNGPFTVNDQGYDTVADAIKGESAKAKTEVEAGKNVTIESRTGADGQTIYQVATADDVEFNNVKVGEVTIDGTTGKISGVAAGDVNPDSTDAINGSQLAKNAQSVSDALGGGSTVNPDGTVTAPNYTVNGADVNNVGDAITALDKGWTLQSNGENAGAVKAGDTVDIGTADGEENLKVAKEGNDIKYSLNRDLKVDSVTAGDTVINNDGMTIVGGPSVTKSGIDAGSKKITGVAPGTVSADSKDAINGSQLHAQGEGVKNIIGGDTAYDPNTGKYTNPDIGGTGKDNINDAISSLGQAAKEAKTTVTEGDNIVVTESKNADGSTNYEVATAKDVTFDSVKVGDVTIDSATGKITGVADGDISPDSKDAINGSQLAKNAQSVSDALGGGSTVNPDGTVSKPNYTVNGDSLNNVGDAITALDKGWTLQSNGANAGAVKAGDTVDIGTADGEENLQVAKEGNDIKYSLNRDLKVDSVTAGDTVINNDGMSIVGGPSVTKSGIDAAGNKISNVAAGTAGTDAVNKDQLDNAAAASKTEVTEGKNITVTKTTGDDGQDIYNVATADDVEFNNVKVGDVSIDGTTGKISGVTDGTIAAGSKEAVNGGQLHGVADSVKNSIGGETTLNPDGTVTTSNVGNTGKNNIHDAIDSVRGQAAAAKTEVTEGKNITVTKTTGDDGQDIYNVATADDVEFNNVKVGDVSIDGTTGKISGVTDGTIAAGSKEAVNGGQLHGVADSVKNAIGGETVLNPNGSITTTNVGNTGQNNIHDAIDSVRGAAVAAKTTVTEGDNIVVTESKNADGSTNYDVATAKDVNFDSVKVGDVTIDSATGKITGVADGDINPDSKDAINGSQLAKNAQSVSDALGGGSTVNPDGTVSKPNYTVNGDSLNNVGDAITALDKGWTLQSNGTNAGAVKAGDTVDIGTADGEENLQVAKEGNDIKYSLNRDLKVDSVTAGDTVINNDGMSIVGGPSVTKTGIDVAGNKISNVAAGTEGTDAVNKDQLDNAAAASKTEVTEGKNITVTKTTGDDGQDIYNVATADDVEFNNVKVGDVSIDGTTGKISGVTDGTIAAGSKEAVNGGQL
ncbi:MULTISPECIES: ESPR-type extended signal peptide-containing protein, partial [unclassified Acinetobacter]